MYTLGMCQIMTGREGFEKFVLCWGIKAKQKKINITKIGTLLSIDSRTY